jgi:hypothetical protein
MGQAGSEIMFSNVGREHPIASAAESSVAANGGKLR